ncbi:hypothetical protein YC2023_067056 [Brassica napus]
MSFLADRENKVIVCPTKDTNSSTCLHFVGTDKYIRVDHHDVGSESSLPGRCDPTLVQIQRGSLGLGTWKAPMTFNIHHPSQAITQTHTGQRQAYTNKIHIKPNPVPKPDLGLNVRTCKQINQPQTQSH